MIPPVKKTIEVGCDPAAAFELFVAKTATWWPLGSHSVSAMDGKTAKAVTIEGKVGGRILETGHDDKVHSWGSVTHFEPGRKLVLAWHINTPAEEASEVEVNFVALDGGRTRVDLEHRNWERVGDNAAQARESYNTGWVGVFEEAYAGACAA